MELPDGYEWIDGGPAMRLIDPEWCPQGHPMQLVQRGWNHCKAHDHHKRWTCGCGQQVWRVGGQFVGEQCR